MAVSNNALLLKCIRMALMLSMRRVLLMDDDANRRCRRRLKKEKKWEFSTKDSLGGGTCLLFPQR
jgi:hypothetical protein